MAETAIATAFCAFSKHLRRVAFCVYVPTKKSLRVCSWTDTASYATLEAVLLQWKPPVLGLSLHGDAEADEKKLHKVASLCGCSQVKTLMVSNPSSARNPSSFEDLFETFAQSRDRFRAFIHAQPPSEQGLVGTLIAWAGLDTPSNYKQFHFAEFPVAQTMRLDRAAYNALNIFPGNEPCAKSDPASSLMGRLNACRTQYGAQLLRMWLSQPTTNVAVLNQRMDIVEALVRWADLRRSIQQGHLRLIANCDTLVGKFRRPDPQPSMSSLQDLLAMQEAAHHMRSIAELVEILLERVDAQQRESISESLTSCLVAPLKGYLERLRKYDDLLLYTLDPEQAQQRVAQIKRELNPKCAKLYDDLRQCWTNMLELRKEVQNELGFEARSADAQQVKLIECPTHGYLFRVTRKDQKYVLSQVQRQKGYRQIRINKAEYQFTTQQLVDLVDTHRDLHKSIEEEQADVIRKTVQAGASYWPVFEGLLEIVAKVDVLCSFAEVASTWKYVRPSLIGLEGTDRSQREIRLVDSRHPLLEASVQLRKFGSTSSSLPQSVITNSTLLDAASFQLITGPNMGGKSTYIRQIALICLMAQIGSFVPCKEARIAVVDAILCRVGASDDQLKGISTFFAEMMEANVVLEAATHNSLILIDELGRGTSTYEGFGLAWELSKTIAERIQCFCLFATHFNELADLQHVLNDSELSRMRCYHVAVETAKDSIVFLYKIVPGTSDKSYGLRIAEMVGLPPSIIARAKELVKTYEDDDNVSMSQDTDELKATLRGYCSAFHLDQINSLTPSQYKSLILEAGS